MPPPTLSTFVAEHVLSAIDTADRGIALSKGQTLFTQGDDEQAIFVVRTGEIEISTYSPDGRKLSLSVVCAGEMFGEVALFGGPRTATAIARSDATVCRIERREVFELLGTDPRLALDFIDMLCERLRHVSEKLEEQTFLPASARLASCLLYLDGRLSVDGRIPISQADLADFVGATRESVARTLAVWKSERLVELARGSIRLLDRSSLRNLAERPDPDRP